LSQWLMMHLNRGVVEGDPAHRLISESSQRELWRPHTNIGFDLVPEAPYRSHFVAYGLGWVLTDRAGVVCVEHTGGLPGMLSRTVLVPELDLRIVVLTNTAPGGLAFRSISQSILDAFLGVEGQDWIGSSKDQLTQIQAESDSVTMAVWAEVRKNENEVLDESKYLGRYRDDWFGEVVIGEKDGQLWFTSRRSPKLNGPMQFYKGNTFAIKWEYRDMNCDAFANFM